VILSPYDWKRYCLSPCLIFKSAKIKIYITVILRVVLRECETWLLTFSEELRWTTFEEGVLRRILERNEARMAKMTNAYKILVEKPNAKNVTLKTKS